MAGFIELSENLEWSSSNWVYYSIMDGLLDEVARLENEELRTDVEQSKWMQTFSLQDIPVHDWRESLIEALKRVCSAIKSGKLVAKVDGNILDESSQKEFKSESQRLLNELVSLSAETAGQ